MSGFTWESGNFKNITATGAVTANPGALLGFYVNSTTAGTLVLRDGGAGGTVMGGTITPPIGFHRFPANFGALGLHATVGGAIDATFFYVLAAGA
jgi:hypothetical protein